MNNSIFAKCEVEIINRKKLLQSLIDEDEFKSLSGILDYEKAIKELKVAVTEM